jgi:anti-sigma factor RsiW
MSFNTCEQLAAHLSDLEDGRASLLERAEARVHLSWCRACQTYVAQFRAVRAQLATLKPAAPPTPAAVEGALAQFRAWSLDAADAATDSDDDGEP